MRGTTWIPTIVLALLLGAAPAAAITFTDVQDAVGLQWVHASDLDNQNYPQTNGSGACWGDVDGDGVDDLFLANGLFVDEGLQDKIDPRSALYLNDGAGAYADVAPLWGVDLSAWAQGCTFADYDGDLDIDLMVVGYDLVHLFRNDGLGFTDVTAAAGLTMAGKCHPDPYCFGETSAWADYDADGDLDVYVTNYVDWDIDEGGPSGPASYYGQPNILWRNDGDGTFTDVTAAAGVDDDPGPQHSKSFQPTWADYDRDGDPDLYIAADTVPNTLFRNNGDGTFDDVAIITGVDDPGAGMGLAFQDVDHDGFPDLYFTHYEFEYNGFYLNEQDGSFADHTGDLGADTEFFDVGWGTGFFDFDNDGLTDIYAVNGHTNPFGTHAQKPNLWLQDTDGWFNDVSAVSGPAFNTASVARGSAVADHDLDGDLDILMVAHFNETARLMENGGNGNHFLQVELREPSGMNRHAIGAEVTVSSTGNPDMMHIVQAGSSFLSQDSLIVHAGLGSATSADVSVRWTDGTVETWTGIAGDDRVRLTKGSASVLRDTIAPKTTITLDGPQGASGWFTGDVTVTVSAIDRDVAAPSGLASTEYRVDGGAWTPYAGPFTLTSEGQRFVEARSTDLAGNVEPARRVFAGIDQDPPVTTLTVVGDEGADGWYRSAVTVVLSALDTASGVAHIESTIDGGDADTATSREIGGSGIHTVDYHGVDNAGHVEAVRTATIKVDGEPPRVQFEAGAFALGIGATTITVDATDPTSGVRSVAFYVDDEATPRATDTDGTDGWSFLLGDRTGLHTVRAEATDAVGFTTSATARVVVVGGTETLPDPLSLPFLPMLVGLLVVGMNRTSASFRIRGSNPPVCLEEDNDPDQ